MVSNKKNVKTWTGLDGFTAQVEVKRIEYGPLTGETRYYADGCVITENGSLSYDGTAITGVSWGWLR